MQRKKLHVLLKDKATADADEGDNGGTRFKCGGHFSRKSIGSAFSRVLGNHASRVKKKHPLDDSVKGDSLTLEDAPSLPKDGAAGEGKSVKMNLSVLGFIGEKKGYKSSTRAGFSGDVHGDGKVKRKASLRHLVRIPSKIMVTRLKLESLIKRKEKKEFEQEADNVNENTPLWKKRILIGERCRPVSSPCYDTNSFYIPRTQRGSATEFAENEKLPLCVSLGKEGSTYVKENLACDTENGFVIKASLRA